MSSLLPAILIGGPPNRGKSVFVYILHQLLKKREAAHYPLRATPDGGGNWFHEGPFGVVTGLRQSAKGKWNGQFEQAVERTLIKRPLPFLVDAGGRPTPKQEDLFGHCTHYIILGKDEAELTEWHAICTRQQLQPLAEVHSTLKGKDLLLSQAQDPLLRVQLGNLDRQRDVKSEDLSKLGEPWQQLATLVADTIGYQQNEMWNHHKRSLSFDEIPLNLEQSIKDYSTTSSRWKTSMLPRLLADTPQQEALAVYGRAPTWVYSALALHNKSAFRCFDAQYGWLIPPTLEASLEDGAWSVKNRIDHHTFDLEFKLSRTHLTPLSTLKGPLPSPPAGKTIILSGKLPIWLYIALARHYQHYNQPIAIAELRAQTDKPTIPNTIGARIPWRESQAILVSQPDTTLNGIR